MRSCHVAKGNFRSEMDLIICRHDRGVGSKKSDRMMVFKKRAICKSRLSLLARWVLVLRRRTQVLTYQNTEVIRR